MPPSSSPPPGIPTISFANCTPDQLAARVVEAGSSCGFFYLADVPIAPALVDRAWQVAQDFFLADDELARDAKLASRDRVAHTGYTAMHEETLDPTDPTVRQGDDKESFYFAQLSASPSRQTLPDALEQHRDTLSTLFEACRETCATLLEAFARGMHLDDAQHYTHQHHAYDDRLRLIHYPPASVGQQQSKIRAGAHTDYGSITLLFQRDVSGLQVWHEGDREEKSGTWIDVAPPTQAGTIVVNVADALEFSTAGVLRSARHRVVMPRDEAESVSRFSMAYFCQPDADAVLDPTRFSAAQRVRTAAAYEAELRRKGITSASQRLTGGEHLQARLQASYTPATATA